MAATITLEVMGLRVVGRSVPGDLLFVDGDVAENGDGTSDQATWEAMTGLSWDLDVVHFYITEGV